MTATEAIANYPVYTEFFVIKEIDIRWGSIRFYNTTIEPATYVVAPTPDPTFYGVNKQLIKVASPDGTGLYPQNFSVDKTLHCFLSAKEAEVWKVLELQGLDDIVEQHMEQLKLKTTKKLKTLKKKIKIDEYIEKYPEELLKVL